MDGKRPLILSLIVLVVTLPMGGVLLLFSSWPARLVGGSFVLAGLFAVGSAIRQARLVSRWEPGQLVMHSWPLRPGDRYHLTYTRVAKSGGSVDGVDVHLRAIEWVRYRRGTDWETAEHEVGIWQLPATLVAATGDVYCEIDLDLASDTQRSINLTHNQFRWYLDVSPQGPDAPDDSSFLIQIGRGLA